MCVCLYIHLVVIASQAISPPRVTTCFAKVCAGTMPRWDFYYQKGGWKSFDEDSIVALNNALEEAAANDVPLPEVVVCPVHWWVNPGGKRKSTVYTVNFRTMLQSQPDSVKERAVKAWWSNDDSIEFDYAYLVANAPGGGDGSQPSGTGDGGGGGHNDADGDGHDKSSVDGGGDGGGGGDDGGGGHSGADGHGDSDDNDEYNVLQPSRNGKELEWSRTKKWYKDDGWNGDAGYKHSVVSGNSPWHVEDTVSAASTKPEWVPGPTKAEPDVDSKSPLKIAEPLVASKNMWSWFGNK